MNKKRKYSEKLVKEIWDIVATGGSISKLAKEHKVPPNTIYKWKMTANQKNKKSAGEVPNVQIPSIAEVSSVKNSRVAVKLEKQMIDLEMQNLLLKSELEIRKKYHKLATAWRAY